MLDANLLEIIEIAAVAIAVCTQETPWSQLNEAQREQFRYAAKAVIALVAARLAPDA